KEYEDCDICANDIFRESWKDSGVERRAFEAPPAMGPKRGSSSPAASNDASQEALIKAITDRVVAELAKR
ncbi:MAG: class II aldolase/adducin family protein, partial [Planctomycetaceae bacterium]|nr:class II aldolase/adducin family protein [Planctomycetaceae bacterium]